MPYANYSPEEVVSRGTAIYEQQIRPTMEVANNKGKFVVIDIETGEYEMDANDFCATDRMLEKWPDAVLFGVRVGYSTSYTLGGHTVEDFR